MEKYCQNCKQPNPADASFCRNCASPLPPAQFSQQQPPPNNQGQAGNQQWNPQGGGGFQATPANFAGPAADKASPRAIAALCLAIASLVLCCGPLTGIPAAILGWMESTAIKQGQSSAKGSTFAQIGLWGGIAMSILSIIGYFFFFLLGLAGSIH